MLSWLQTAPERLQEHTGQIKQLLLANVDQLYEMITRKVKTPIPPTRNWITTNIIHLLWALLKIELPLDPETTKDIPAKEKEVKIENCFWLAVVWSFGCTTDA